MRVPHHLRHVECAICLRPIRETEYRATHLCPDCTPVQQSIDALINRIRAAAVKAELAILAKAEEAAPLPSQPPETKQFTERTLSTKAVCAKVGLDRSTIHDLERAGKFPKRIRLTPRKTVWVESEIDAWITQQRRGMAYVG